MRGQKIAIACQGGGSHTAFTAGVLSKLIDRNVHKEWEIVGLSGTSGGALCATIMWYGLLEEAKGNKQPLQEGLLNFWRDNSALSSWEKALNSLTIETVRLQDGGYMPAFAPNPYSNEGLLKSLMALSPRREYIDFQALLQKHIPFQKLPSLIQPVSPRLVLGAVDVISGMFKAFDSKKDEIHVEAVRASAAIPNIFQAVQIGDGAYWDGLFSQNPPISPFVDEHLLPEERADELWVVQINPITRPEEPKTASDIQDRRNELAGNLSLLQEITFIERVNNWIDSGAFHQEFLNRTGLKRVKVRFIAMGDELANSLDYASKLDRDPASLNMLIVDGQQQAEKFLDHLANEELVAN